MYDRQLAEVAAALVQSCDSSGSTDEVWDRFTDFYDRLAGTPPPPPPPQRTPPRAPAAPVDPLARPRRR